jgi:tryptophan 7-halogenase
MVSKVVIIGRDAPLWLSALALYRALAPAGVTVEVVELPGLVQAQDIHTSLPALEAFHRQLGLDEHALLKRTGGSFTLGQSFQGFAGDDGAFFHPYGSHGFPITTTGAAFLHYVTRARRQGLGAAFEDFSLTAAAAKQGRFIVPDDDVMAFARSDYGYHLPARAYAEALSEAVRAQGIAVHPARHVTVEWQEGGDIAAVNGISGDLFVDASGSASVLVRGALATPFDSWPGFPADRILTASGPRLRSLPPYARIQALDNGLLGMFAAQDATRITYAFNSQAESDEAALQMAATSRLRLGDAVVTPLEQGRSEPWVRNVVAIGEAACVFDPVDGLSLHSVQAGLVHLLGLFPRDGHRVPERAEYNRRMGRMSIRARDFQLVRYHLSRRVQPFWQRARAHAMPAELRERIEAFTVAGQVPLFDEDTFEIDSWNAILIGHGLSPEAYDPAADLAGDHILMDHFRRIFSGIRLKAERAPSHDEYLEIFCTA